MTLDELILLKKLLPKLTKIIDTDIEAKRYEDFDYTPRSTTAYKRAKERTEADDTPFLIRDLIDNLPDNTSLNRFVLRLYYISGTTHTEIALRLGLAQSTTSDRLKGLKKIVRESNETKTD